MEDVENWYKNIIQDLTGFNEEFLGNLSQVGGLRGISSLFALMNSTDADVEQLSNAVVNSEGRASGMAQTLLDNLQGDVTILNSAIDGLKIALFDEVNPLAREFVQILTSGVSEVTEMIRGKNGDAVDQAIQREKEAIGGAEADAAKASGIVGYMDTLVAEYGDAAKNTESWAAALKKLEEVMPGITREIKDQSGSASDMTKSMKEYIELTKEQKIEAARQKAVEEYQKIADEAKANLEKAQIQQAVEGGGAESYLTSILEYIAGKQGVEDTGAFVSQWKEYLAGRKDRNLIIDKMIEPYLEEGGEYNYTLGELVESWEESLESYGTNTAEIDRLTDLYNKAEAKLQAANAAYGYLTSAAYDYANNLTGGVGGETDGSHAKGDWFVPYDNYVANLHRGEMVLTASQARRFREGTQTAMDMEALRSAIVSAVMEGMENAQVNAYMDGRRVTEEVSRRLNNELALRR